MKPEPDQDIASQISDAVGLTGISFDHNSMESSIKSHICCHVKRDRFEQLEDNRRIHFCNWILWAVHDSVLEPELILSTDEAWFHMSEIIKAQNNRYWSSVTLRATFEEPIHN
jgi:hypothetical protein